MYRKVPHPPPPRPNSRLWHNIFCIGVPVCARIVSDPRSILPPNCNYTPLRFAVFACFQDHPHLFRSHRISSPPKGRGDALLPELDEAAAPGRCAGQSERQGPGRGRRGGGGLRGDGEGGATPPPPTAPAPAPARRGAEGSAPTEPARQPAGGNGKFFFFLRRSGVSLVEGCEGGFGEGKTEGWGHSGKSPPGPQAER